MRFDEFKDTLTQIEPSAYWSVMLKALWYQAKGDWQSSHDIVEHESDRESALIHAFLHRVEGDLWNARYWYNRAKQPEFLGSIEEELRYLVERYGG